MQGRIAMRPCVGPNALHHSPGDAISLHLSLQ